MRQKFPAFINLIYAGVNLDISEGILRGQKNIQSSLLDVVFFVKGEDCPGENQDVEVKVKLSTESWNWKHTDK